jgi:Uma2 family endonuclease
MSAAEKWHFVTVEDYLAEEEVSPVKREYRDGIVYDMAGARNVHNDISVRALGQLYLQLRGKPCKPCNSDTKVRILLTSGTRFYYPDAFVVRNPNPANDACHDAPVVVLEVTSTSTRRIDLGEKKDAYLAIPTLMVYLVAESTEAVVQVFRRSPNGDFHRELAIGLEAIIPLPEIGVTLALADLYEGIDFEAEAAALRVMEEEALYAATGA